MVQRPTVSACGHIPRALSIRLCSSDKRPEQSKGVCLGKEGLYFGFLVLNLPKRRMESLSCLRAG